VLRVERPDGEVLWEPKPERRDVLEPAVAYLVTDVLREAIARGTGTAVRQAGFQGPVAGKTGTTNDGADAWFVGYTPEVVATVWMGFDQPRPIVPQATGGRVAAPVWARMMLRFYQGRPMPKAWAPPSGVLEATIDPATGLVLASGCQSQGGARREVFLARDVPREICPWNGDPVFYVPSPEPLDEELMADLPPELTEEPADGARAEAAPAASAADEPLVPTPSPAPSATPLPEPTPTPAPAATPMPEVTPTADPTPTPPLLPGGEGRVRGATVYGFGMRSVLLIINEPGGARGAPPRPPARSARMNRAPLAARAWGCATSC
jgi:penicillin-binding protein 1A